MDTETKIQKKIKKLKGLTQYRNYSEEQLRRLAEHKVSLEEKNVDLDLHFDDAAEKARAEELFSTYMKNAHLESPGEISSLKTLVDLEIFGDRLRKMRDKATAELKGFALPKTLMESLDDNIKQITTLQKTLGILKDKEDNKDSFDAFKSLMQKGKLWEKENPTRTLRCKHCQKMLHIRLKNPEQVYEAIKHPMFKDKIWYNEPLLKAVEENKVSKQLAADILNTSVQYIDWLLEKFHNSKAVKNG